MKYTKVIIKSADDLPKKEGEYFAHRIDYNEITFRTFKIGEPKLHYNHAYYLNFWLKNIDWYLIEDTEHSDCNHVVGAADESGCCIKCGKKVCEIINNNLCQK